MVLAFAPRAQLFSPQLFRGMKNCRTFVVSIFALSIFAILHTASALDRSVSSSGQFAVYGEDVAWRGSICDLAERTKSDLLGILKRRDQWATPIVINLESRAANAPEIPGAGFRFSQTGAGIKLQLDLVVSRNVNAAEVEHELLRAILLEMIYRNQTGIASGESYVEPPAWLVEGLLALMPDHDRGLPINALTVSEHIEPLDQFLRENPQLLDSIGRSIYRANSSALVQVLIDSADGRGRLGRYIDNLAFASNDPLADLQRNFPQVGGSDFEKIWKAKIASAKDSSRTDLLTFSQTNEKLDTLVGTLSLEKLCQKKPNASEKLSLKKFDDELLLLAARANPALRPIVQEYQKLAVQLALGKNHGVAAKLSDLKSLRIRLVARMTEIDDYMNWFEATQLSAQSGLFEDYLKASTEVSAPRRKDGLSIYLDAMESQF
jgi:hypothetical protein